MRLLDTNRAGRVVPITLIEAPAGFGKSTFAAQWCRRTSVPTAWINLRNADNDPRVLLDRLTSAIRQGGRVEADHHLPQASSTDGGLIGLVDRWQAQAPLVLVLDDAHVVTEPVAVTVLRALVEAATADHRIVVITRTPLQVGLSRRRSSGDVNEFRAHELALDEDELVRLLTLTSTPATPDDARDLWQATEGWPAAIGLAVLAHSLDTPRPSLRQLSGSDQGIAEYFLEEVLSASPPPYLEMTATDMKRFLTSISPLPMFCAPICDVVTGRTDSAAVLDHLVRANLFVTPLDSSRGWFRFHHLFRQLLEDELVRSGQDEVALVNRAAQWYEFNGYPDEAFELARRSGDLDRLGRILLGERDLAVVGRLQTLVQRLGRLSETEIESDAQLALGAAWTAAQSGDASRALRYLAITEGADLDRPSADGATTLRSSWLNLRGTIGAEGVQQMLDDGLALVASESASRSIRLAGAYRIVGVAQLMLGRPLDAIAAMDEVDTLTMNQPALTYVRAFCLGYAGLARADLAQWTQSEHTVDTAVSLIERFGSSVHCLPVWASQATVQAHRGEVEHAATTLTKFQALMPMTVGAPCLRADMACRAAEIAHLIGDDRAGHEWIDVARIACHHICDAGTIPERIDHLETKMAPGAPGLKLLTPAETRVLRQMATHRTLQQIAEHLFVSRTTVKTHVASIYSKLGVSTRAEAVIALGDSND